MNKIIITLSLFVAASVSSAPPTPLEIHRSIFKHLKMVRDHLVPAPAIHFVETFPPIAIPREKILQLAMLETEPFEEPVPPPTTMVHTFPRCDTPREGSTVRREDGRLHRDPRQD